MRISDCSSDVCSSDLVIAGDRSSILSLRLRNPVPQSADALHLDFADIAGYQPGSRLPESGHACRSAGYDNIAGVKHRDRGDIGNNVRAIENEVVILNFLTDGSVHPGQQLQHTDVHNLIRRSDPRANTALTGKIISPDVE